MQRPHRFSRIRFRLSAAVSAITLVSILLLAALFLRTDFDKTVSAKRGKAPDGREVAELQDVVDRTIVEMFARLAGNKSGSAVA